MVSANALQGAPGEDLVVDELQAYLGAVCPVLLGLDSEGERSAETFRRALITPDAAALLHM